MFQARVETSRKDVFFILFYLILWGNAENKKVKNINELEIVEDKIYANTYQFNKDVVLIIDKNSGAVDGIINFGDLRNKVKQHPELDVLNGIAYNKKRGTFFVTGKKWNKIFEIKITKN